MSDAGPRSALFNGLPHDPGALATVVQGLLIISTLRRPTA